MSPTEIIEINHPIRAITVLGSAGEGRYFSRYSDCQLMRRLQFVLQKGIRAYGNKEGTILRVCC